MPFQTHLIACPLDAVPQEEGPCLMVMPWLRRTIPSAATTKLTFDKHDVLWLTSSLLHGLLGCQMIGVILCMSCTLNTKIAFVPNNSGTYIFQVAVKVCGILC